MTDVSGEQYAIGAFCVAIENGLHYDVSRTALVNCNDGKSLDDNIQAAIHAAEWLQEITKR